MENSPYAVWVKIGIVLLVLAGVSIGTWTMAVKVTDAKWVNQQNELVAAQNKKVDGLNAKISDLEASARGEQERRTADYLKGLSDGNKQTEDTIAALRSTNSGLWLKVHAANDEASGAKSAAAKSARDAATAAQLTTETSEALIRITADGDNAIKQLNLCQVEYKSLWDFSNTVVDEVNKYRFGK